MRPGPRGPGQRRETGAGQGAVKGAHRPDGSEKGGPLKRRKRRPTVPGCERSPRSVLLVLSACATAKFTPVGEIANLTKLADVMDNQMGAADPQFAKIGAATLSDADFAGFAQASERLLVTSAKIKDFSKDFPKDPAGFEALGARLNERAKALGGAAAAKDAAASKTALTAMKATCKECHSKFR